MIDPNEVWRAFQSLYDSGAPRLFRAPGRVNLIGEHTDYNDGFVMPMAINRDTVVAARAREDRLVRVHTLNLNESVEFDLDHPGPGRRGHWLDYVEGIAQSLEQRGFQLRGADLALKSDVPVGSGLSSSAALEISTGFALLSVSEAEIDKVQLALAGQQAEHDFAGAKVGIMDQYIAALGQAGHALLIDCRSLEPTLIPMNLPDTAVVICDTRVKHELASSEYNTRRAECERGVELLREVLLGIRALRDVSTDEFERYQDRLPDPINRRCRHVITENARTLLAADALKAGDLQEIGGLMYRSHDSLRDDYEVSCAELDLLVDIARSLEGVAGARMTGGGFGGCTVNLVRQDKVEQFQEKISREYQSKIGHPPFIYISEASNGAEELGKAGTGEQGQGVGEAQDF